MSRIKILIWVTLLIPAICLATPAKPLTWQGYAVAFNITNFHGGLRPGTLFTTAGRLTATFDTQTAALWQGGKLAIGFIAAAQTRDSNVYSGVIQNPCGFTSYSQIRFTDFAYQQKFTDYFLIRAGIMEFDDYFNKFEVSDNLFNSAFANTETMNIDALLASYPFPGFGAFAKLGDAKQHLLLGIYQGNPQHQHTVFHDGQLILAEFTKKFPIDLHNVDCNFRLGVWDYQQRNVTVSYVSTRDHGVYIIGQAEWLFKGRIVGTGLNLGFSPKKYNTVSASASGCFVINGLFKSRPIDSLNLGFGSVWLNGAPRVETFIEINYAWQITPDLALIPDLQYFFNPSGIYPNSWEGVLRLQYVIPT